MKLLLFSLFLSYTCFITQVCIAGPLQQDSSGTGQALSINIYTGRIVDAQNGGPVVGASIVIEGTKTGTYTDAEGMFRLAASGNNRFVITVTAVGYKTIRIENYFAGVVPPSSPIRLEPVSVKTAEIFVTANKKIQSVQEVPISYSVIDKDFLQNRSISSLEKALEYIPGIEVNRDNISIRGTSGFSLGVGSRAALLMDGFPILSGDNADMKFDAMPFYNIERIEIVKGAGSALYGTGALGGVINIITADAPAEGKFKVRAYSGLFDDPKHEVWQWSDDPRFNSGADLSYSKKYGSTGLTLSGGYVDKMSHKNYDKAERYNGFLKLDHALSEFTKITFTGNAAFHTFDDWLYWRSLNSPLQPSEASDTTVQSISNKVTAIASVNHILENNSFLVFRTGAFMTFVSNTADPASDIYRQSDALSWNSELQYTFDPAEDLSMTSGLNLTMNSIEAALYGNNNQNIFSAYSQLEYKAVTGMNLTAGARIDKETLSNDEMDVPDTPLQFSPKLGISLRTDANNTLRASVGRGFRAASIAERFSSTRFSGFNVVPNPLLKSETSYSAEIGYNTSWLETVAGFPLNFDMAFFGNFLNNLIEPEFTQAGSADIQFQNITEARILGAEFNLRTLIAGFIGFETGVMIMDPQDLTKKTTLKYRSRLNWQARLFIPITKSLIWQTDYRYRSKVDQIDRLLALQVANSVQDDGSPLWVEWNVVDMRLIYNTQEDLGLPLRITAGAYNLTNYYYLEMVGNMAPLRSFNLMIEYGI